MTTMRRMAGLLLLVALAGCTRELDSGERLPSDQGPMPRLQRSSTVALSASIPLSRLQALLEDATPASWDVDEKLTALKIRFHGRLERSPIALVPSGGQIGFSSSVSGHGSAPTSWDVKGTLRGSLLPQIGRDYRLASNLDVAATLSEARLKLKPFGDLSVRGQLERLLASKAPSARARLDASLNREDKLRAEAAELWKSAHGVSRLGRKGDAHLVYRPTSLVVSSPVVSGKSLAFGLGVTAQLEVIYGDAPPAPAPSPLPPALIRPIRAGRIEVHLPLIADPAALAATFSKRLETRKVKLGDKGVRITKVEAAGVGHQLLLKCRVRDERWWRPLEADLFLTGTPYLDETDRSLHLRDLEFTVRSKDMLVHAASYLLSPVLTQYITETAVYPVTPLEEKSKDDAMKWADDLAKKSDGAFRTTVTEVRVDAVDMQAGFIVVEASATGTVATNVEPLLANAR